MYRKLFKKLPEIRETLREIRDELNPHTDSLDPRDNAHYHAAQAVVACNNLIDDLSRLPQKFLLEQ